MSNTYEVSSFLDGLKELGITLEEKQQEQFVSYYEILVEWNKVMNLTGITQWEDVVTKHFLDSLSIVKALDLKKAGSVIDIGTGAGFPGIPLKIAFPHLKIVLLDSLKKRIHFLDEVIQTLKIDKIRTIHGRAEDFAKDPAYRESFDLAVSRAVASLNTLSEYCVPFVKKGGFFISYKSGKIEEELSVSEKAIKVMGGKLDGQVKFHLTGTDMERSFVVVKKTANTPKKYPRKAGLPSKEPIC